MSEFLSRVVTPALLSVSAVAAVNAGAEYMDSRHFDSTNTEAADDAREDSTRSAGIMLGTGLGGAIILLTNRKTS